jgi:hypothetical protein
MPFNIFRKLRSFIDDFLNVILAEASMASIVHLLESRNDNTSIPLTTLLLV